MLMGYGGLTLPTNVPANQYVTFLGSKASATRGVGIPIGTALERYEPDALRYALAKNLPENNDTDLTDEQIARSINEELVATWGNLVNRVVSMTHRYFDGVVPEPGDLKSEDEDTLDAVDTMLDDAATQLRAVRLKAGLASAMAAAQTVNIYLSDQEPWKSAKTDLERAGTVLWVALNAIAGVAVALAPYLPVTSVHVLDTLGIAVTGRAPVWERPAVAAGTTLGAATPLFSKVDVDADSS